MVKLVIISATKKNPFLESKKNMLTNRVHVILQLLGSIVEFLKKKGEIKTGTRNIEPLVD